MTLEGMRWSKFKVKDILVSMKGDEHFIEYVIPLLRYHSRWDELTAEDWKYLFHRDKVSHNGYYMRADVKPAGTFPKDKKLGNYQFSEKAYEYLDKITEVCKRRGIELVLVKAPSLYPSWYEQWDQQMIEYARKNQIKYLNFRNLQEEIGLDYETDTYDGGLHLNIYGAEKLTGYFGQFLKEEYGMEDRRNDADLARVWAQKAEFYYGMKSEQKEDVERYGYIRKFWEE